MAKNCPEKCTETELYMLAAVSLKGMYRNRGPLECAMPTHDYRVIGVIATGA